MLVLLAALMATSACSGSATDPETLGTPLPDRSDGSPSGSDAGPTGPTDGSSSDGASTPPVPDAFAKGDAFDYAKVKTRSQMVASMLTSFGYATSTLPRAIAVDADGFGYVSVLTGGATQADAESTALDACFVIGGGKPCGLLASADTFAVDESKLAATLTHVLAKPAALTDLPFVAAGVRSAKITAYQALTGVKALAVALDGTVVSVPFASTSAAVATAAEAMRVALERCEMQATFVPCTLFAAGSTAVYDPASPTRAPQVRWTDKTVHMSLPGVTNAIFSSQIVPYLNAVGAGQAGSIFLTNDGAGGDQFGAGNVDPLALAQCQQHADPGATCFKYASQATVVMSPANIAAPKAAGAAHCESMPRTDCAAHHALGCTSSGLRYTTHTGTVTLEMCTF